MIGESADGMTGEPVYCALMKGTFSLDSMEFKTKGEKEEQPETTKLTGDWMNRNIEVDGTLKVLFTDTMKVNKVQMNS